MKKSSLLIICISVSIHLFGQNTFFTKYSTHQTDRSFDAVQANDGSFIIVGKRSSTPYEEDVHGLVMKTDENGNFLKEITLINQVRTYFFIIGKIPNVDDEFIVIGSKDSIVGTDLFSSIMIYRIDLNLAILSMYRTHRMKNHRILPWKHTFVNDSTLILQAGTIPNTSATSSFIISELRLPADSIRSYISEPETIRLPGDVIHIPKNNEIHAIYFGGNLDDTSAIKILRLDEELNKIETLQSPSRAFSTPCATQLTDSTYLLTATSRIPHGSATGEAISTFKMDEGGNGLQGIQYFNHPDTILYAGFGTNTAILNNSIFITGLYNIDPFEIPWQDTPTWVQVTKLDMNLNIESHHFYGGDALYAPYCIIPTLDNGIFITGYIYDYNSGEQQHDIFALKLNSDGLIVDMPENAPWQTTEAILYPNPASEILNIEFSQVYQKATFQFMDMGGKTVLEKQLPSNYQSINISALPAGTYVYRIFNKEGLDERGKVVVE
jgi:hypothetical protein